MAEPVKWRGRSVAVPPGEAFEFHIAAPAEGGCDVRYNYSVHEELSVSFSIKRSDDVVLVSEEGASKSGEVVLPSGSVCAVRWENASLFAFSGMINPRVVTYEVLMIPHAHTALARRRRLVQLAQGGGSTSELLAALAELAVDCEDERGRTPLHGAAAGGNVPSLTALVQRGAPLEARGADGCTPLLEACAHAQPAAVSTLLALGADVTAVDGTGRNAMHLACLSAPACTERVPTRPAAAPASPSVTPASPQASTLRLLLDVGGAAAEALRAHLSSGVEPGELWRETPLVCAARAGLAECCLLLLDAGADANECGGLPLLSAARCGRLEAVRTLLSRGADSTRAVGPAGTALHAASAAGHAEVITLLAAAAAAADPEATGAAFLHTDGEWRAPLMVAAAHGHGDAVEALVAAGAPIEHPTDRLGNTPLLRACAAGDPKAIGVLLQAGARPRHKNGAGHDALLIAAIGGHLPVLPLLLPACGKTLPDAMVQAAAHGQARTAVALMELCPFPLPDPSESRAAAAASARLLQALWQRCCEEHVGIDPTSLALEAAGGFGEKAVAAAAASRSGGAAVAAAAAAGGAAAAANAAAKAPALGAPRADGTRAETPTSDRPSAAAAEAAEGAASPAADDALVPEEVLEGEDDDLGIDDLTNIQELIRRELLEDDDDDDAKADDEAVITPEDGGAEDEDDD